MADAASVDSTTFSAGGTAAEDDERRLKHTSVPQRPSSFSDHLVTNLPYLREGDFPTKHYAGHLPAST
eukprot:4386004-Ditylum_brightwellii.AAC.1